MKTEEARQLAESGIANLAAALKQGKSESLAAYLTALARFHRYSCGNVMLIISQRPDASRVAGFRTWKKLGRHVKQGEKGIAIIAPMVIRGSDQDSADEDGRIVRFKSAYVFDVSQTDGEPLPELPDVGGHPGGYTERLKQAIARRGIDLTHAGQFEAIKELGNADGASLGGKIIIRNDLAPASEFTVLVHELAHEMMHRDKNRESLLMTVRETEAEAVAFVVGKAIGLAMSTASQDYIQLYSGDESTLGDSLDRIQKTATAIIQEISDEAGHEQPTSRAA